MLRFGGGQDESISTKFVQGPGACGEIQGIRDYQSSEKMIFLLKFVAFQRFHVSPIAASAKKRTSAT